MKKTILLTILLSALFTASVSAKGTDSLLVETDTITTKSKFMVDAGIDVLNNFIWRGIPLDMGPN
ncbi:MAG: hypothetical protein M3142_07410, partial [Bacteroidota bacterium]|nr:hypothetical protein [Bacteroidota bacterium]